MKSCYNLLFAAVVILAASLNAFAQAGSDKAHLSSYVESFNYETLKGTVVIEAFVEDGVGTGSTSMKPLDVVLMIDTSNSMENRVEDNRYEAKASATYDATSYYENYAKPGNKLFYLHEGQYYEVSRNGSLYLYFNDENNKMLYLVGTEVSSTRPTTNTSWTGVLYERTYHEDFGSRLEVVQQACCSLADALAESSSSTADNRVAVGHFNTTADVDIDFTGLSSGISAVKSAISSLSCDGETHTDLGAQVVSDIIGSSPSSERDHVVLFFTDGEPNSWTYADDAIAEFKDLKDLGVTIYTVSILGDMAQSSNASIMMNYLSSNYPYATSLSNGGTRADGDYFFNSPTGTEIPNIFNTIASEIDPSRLGADVEVKDIFLPSVSIDDSSVKTFTADCSDYVSATGVFTFDDDLDELSGMSINVTADPASGKQTLVVSGFDYSDNWCGLDGSGDAHGKELVLKIPFSFAPAVSNLDDKELELEDGGAGMYKDTTKVTSAKFLSDPIEFAELIIEKKGLLTGESAIFEIVREKIGSETADVPVNRIVLTGVANDGTSVSQKLRFLNSAATYIVIEHADWSWTYKPKETVTSGLVTKSQKMPDAPTGTNGAKSATLAFENTKFSEDKLPSNAEAIKN